MKLNRSQLMVAAVAVVAIGAVLARSRFASPPLPHLDKPFNEELHQSIGLGANYLAKYCESNGRFVYITHLDPAVRPVDDYNEVRHAGALYPMGEYYRLYNQDPKIKEAMVRAARYFIKTYIGPIPDTNGQNIPNLLGCWSPEEEGNPNSDPEMKLGGMALGLVGLVETEKVAPGSIPLKTLRQLADGIIFMQEADGRFYSKYNPNQGGHLAQWESLYYPGEAALGLAMMYERDPDPQQKKKWLKASFAAVGFLAKLRQGLTDLPADHWVLIATAKLWPHYPSSDGTIPRHLLLGHVIQLCKMMLADPYLHTDRTTPVATRLEGLIASLNVLPVEQDEMKGQIREAARQELTRLMACQVKVGNMSGAIPRNFDARPPAPGASTNPKKTLPEQRADEVRIDYVQHAISAMMTYDRVVLKNPALAKPLN